MKIKLEINSAGIIENRGIHDAEIVETKLSGRSNEISASVICESEQGELFVFKLENVRLFSVNFYGPQNIIRDVLVFTKCDARAELLDIRDLEIQTFERYDRLNELILEGSLTLVKFIPSVGTQIDCLCKTVSLEQPKKI